MSDERARLAPPDAAWKDSYIDAVREFIRAGDAIQWDPAILRQRFDEYVRVLRQAETEPLAGYVPSTHYWLIGTSGVFLGEVNLRHRLNPSLLRFGGHIGYKIRPSARRQGYGKLICRLALEQARARGIGDLLLTCDDDNIGSIKVIEANGGRGYDLVNNNRGVLTRRYWIRAGN